MRIILPPFMIIKRYNFTRLSVKTAALFCLMPADHTISNFVIKTKQKCQNRLLSRRLHNYTYILVSNLSKLIILSTKITISETRLSLSVILHKTMLTSFNDREKD